jgi:hypothetical protein
VVGARFGGLGRVSSLLEGNGQIEGRQRQGYGSFSVIKFFDSFFVFGYLGEVLAKTGRIFLGI